PVVDLGGVDDVRVAAVHLVDGRELPGGLPRAAEPADDGAVELHLVDLAGELGAGGRCAVLPRVGREQVLLAGVLRAGPAGDAHGPGIPHLVVVGLPVQVVVEYLDARVATIAHVHVAL